MAKEVQKLKMANFRKSKAKFALGRFFSVEMKPDLHFANVQPIMAVMQ